MRLCSYGDKQYTQAEAFFAEVTALRLAREAEREQRRLEKALSPSRGTRFQPSLERFRTHPKYHDRPAAADIAFCAAAFASGMAEDSMVRALEDDYLSRDPNPSKRTAYIRRTMTKAREWAAH